MIDYEKTERFLKALADKSRLQILECIPNEVANPGEIAKKLDRHRSTVEKHLRVLLKAGSARYALIMNTDSDFTTALSSFEQRS